MGSDFRPPFIKIDSQITLRCDARCEFCPAWRDDLQVPPDMPPEQWIDVARRLQEFTAIDMFCICGGEPLLYKELPRVVRGINDLGIRTVVVSNGRLLTRRRCDALLEAGLDEINVSLDSYPQLHDEMRNTPGIFDRAVSGVRYFKERRPQMKAAASILITSRNLDHLPEYARWLLDWAPLDFISFQAYNQLIPTGRDWASFLDDPLWPSDTVLVDDVMDELAGMVRQGVPITNHPDQFELFKRYFRDPDKSLGIRCPAGMLSFTVSSDGYVAACLHEPPVGNILHDDPVELFRDKFPAIREKARHCCINCHFLINCLYYLNWKEIDESDLDLTPRELREQPPVAGDAGAAPAEGGDAGASGGGPGGEPAELGGPAVALPDTAEDPLTPGRLVLPPEIREDVQEHRIHSCSLLSYEDNAHLDLIGTDVGPADERHVPPEYRGEAPAVYLAGDTSELHRWGVPELDENDWYRQVAALEQFLARGELHHTIVPVRRTNMHRLPRIYDFIRARRGMEPCGIAPLELGDPATVRERFQQHLELMTERGGQEGIQFEVMDPQLGELLQVMERAAGRDDFDEKEYLMALGPVCKDVFTGPRYLLVDANGQCNTDCVYCRQFSPWLDDEELAQWRERGAFNRWDIEFAERVLRQGRALGVRKVVIVGRGEPTIHPQFDRMLELIRELGMTFVVSTNGIMIDRHMEAYLDESCDSVTVSLSFASEDTFRNIRPTTKPAMRERIERNVTELTSRRRAPNRPQVTALYAINKLNCHEVVQMAHHAHRLGADAIWFQLVHLSDFIRDKLYMDEQDMAQVRQSLREARELCRQWGIEWHAFIDFEMEHYNEEKGDWSRGGMLAQGCYVGWHFAFVSLNKEVFMCCGNQTMGVLDNDRYDLEQMWYSDRWRRYRNDGLVMHRENPLDINGRPLYNAYCESCDNHDQQMLMLEILGRYGLGKFVER